jgi:simple sugar transport system substrate-binding protein
LGPLINDETRRLAASAYLGAKHCWTENLGNDVADLSFRVDWIGFWFNIPGVTADPTQVADNFYNSGYDVVISGLDTTEGLVQARAAAEAGNDVYNVAYDYEGACEIAPEVCLGSVVFNWRPFYLAELTAMTEGTWTPSWQWPTPDYANFTDHAISTSFFVKGEALSEDVSAQVDAMVEELAGGLNLWVGPLNLQDGTEYLAEGEEATLQQIWYLPQLLEGMEGQSVPQ